MEPQLEPIEQLATQEVLVIQNLVVDAMIEEEEGKTRRLSDIKTRVVHVITFLSNNSDRFIDYT